MHVSVYSLKKILYQGNAASVNCKTTAGEITVLNHHRPLISVLPKGLLKVTDSGEKEHYFEIDSGFLEMRDTNELRLLVEE